MCQVACSLLEDSEVQVTVTVFIFNGSSFLIFKGHPAVNHLAAASAAAAAVVSSASAASVASAFSETTLYNFCVMVSFQLLLLVFLCKVFHVSYMDRVGK